MLLTPFVADATDEKTQAFVPHTKRISHVPNQFAADAYDAMLIDQSSCRKSRCNTGYETLLTSAQHETGMTEITL